MSDQPPVEQVLADLYPFVAGYVGKRVRPDMVDDTVQDVMVSLFRSWPRLQYDPVRLRGLVATVAGRRVADAWRAWARQVPPATTLDEDELVDVEVADPAPGPEQLALDAVAVAELLAGLPDRDRRVLALRVLLDWPADAVGEELGMTAAAVRVVQTRALDRAAAQVASDRNRRSRFRPGGRGQDVAPPPP